MPSQSIDQSMGSPLPPPSPAVVGLVRHLHNGLRDDVAGPPPVHRIHAKGAVTSGVLGAGRRQHARPRDGHGCGVVVLVAAAVAAVGAVPVAVVAAAARVVAAPEVAGYRIVVPEAAE